METNSTHAYFRSRIMLCFDDEKQKVKKAHSNTIASQNILFINAIVCCSSSFVLFLKTGILDVASGVIFHIN